MNLRRRFSALLRWIRSCFESTKQWCLRRLYPLGGHCVSMYDPVGNFMGGTRGDLWSQVTRPPCWLVDNNIPWEETARSEPGQNFVLGRTMVMESDSLRGALRRIKRNPLPNAYTLEIQEVRGLPVILIDRVGATLQRKFRGKIPTVKSLSDSAREAVNSTAIRNAKRERVRQHETREPTELLAEILRLKPQACRNYILAGELSLAVYALHLRQMRGGPARDRVRKFEDGHPSLFGDAEVIQEALFLNVGIFSNDHHDVIRMASMLGIPTRTN